VNGEFVDEADAKVSVWDHGFLYGDGVFEGIRCYDGRIFRLQQHLERLYHSANAIFLQIPLGMQEMGDVICEALRRNNLRDSYIRLVVSRGKGDLGIDPANCENPTIVVITAPLKLYPPSLYETGLELIICQTRRTPVQCVDPSIKSCNYLNNILAKVECLQRGLKEGVMLNTDGLVSECTADNIFVVRGSRLSTPRVTSGILRGITRSTVLELGRELGLDVREEDLAPIDLYTADEVFLTGTGAEIIGVVKIDGRIVGEGRPGPKTGMLLEAFRELVKRDGHPVYAEQVQAARV
jgi:branched-chain amino acid aminotransferase